MSDNKQSELLIDEKNIIIKLKIITQVKEHLVKWFNKPLIHNHTIWAFELFLVTICDKGHDINFTKYTCDDITGIDNALIMFNDNTKFINNYNMLQKWLDKYDE